MNPLHISGPTTCPRMRLTKGSIAGLINMYFCISVSNEIPFTACDQHVTRTVEFRDYDPNCFCGLTSSQGDIASYLPLEINPGETCKGLNDKRSPRRPENAFSADILHFTFHISLKFSMPRPASSCATCGPRHGTRPDLLSRLNISVSLGSIEVVSAK